eukprot:6176188-Pleurochrysis_carterae.AAC.2
MSTHDRAKRKGKGTRQGDGANVFSGTKVTGVLVGARASWQARARLFIKLKEEMRECKEAGEKTSSAHLR